LVHPAIGRCGRPRARFFAQRDGGGEFDEIPDGLRSDFGQQLDPDAPEVSDLDDRVGVWAFGDQILRGYGLFDRDFFCFTTRGEQQSNQQNQRCTLHDRIRDVGLMAGSATNAS
jgi:hypothetical protein